MFNLLIFKWSILFETLEIFPALWLQSSSLISYFRTLTVLVFMCRSVIHVKLILHSIQCHGQGSFSPYGYSVFLPPFVEKNFYFVKHSFFLQFMWPYMCGSISGLWNWKYWHKVIFLCWWVPVISIHRMTQ